MTVPFPEMVTEMIDREPAVGLCQLRGTHSASVGNAAAGLFVAMIELPRAD